MAKRRESPNWATVERLLRLAAQIASLIELLCRAL
jgi:hypothetical protein